MAFLILEGNDGTGKTTLAQRLLVDFSALHVPVGPPRDPEHAFAEYVEDVMRWSVFDRVIFDRFHFGTYAYGTAYRDGPDFTDDEWRLLEQMLKTHKTLLVLCDNGEAENEITLRERRERGEQSAYEDPGRIAQIRSLMRAAYEMSSLPKMVYDYRIDSSYEDVRDATETVLRWNRGETYVPVRMR